MCSAHPARSPNYSWVRALADIIASSSFYVPAASSDIRVTRLALSAKSAADVLRMAYSGIT